MRIQRIYIKNLKAIIEQDVEFNGKSVIITGANNSGKSTLAMALINRFRSKKPSLILHDGQENGMYIMELTDGSKIEWNFDNKNEKFIFTSADGVVSKTGVLKQIGEKYFGIGFDVDKFILSAPKVQKDMLLKLIGVDLSDIEKRYKDAYAERTRAKAVLDALIKAAKAKPIVQEFEDVEAKRNSLNLLKEQYEHAIKVATAKVEAANLTLKTKFEADKQAYEAAKAKADKYESTQKAIIAFLSNYNAVRFFDIESFKKENASYIPELPVEPQYAKVELGKEFDGINSDYFFTEQSKLSTLELKQQAYATEVYNYNEWVEQGKSARAEAERLEKLVKSIEKEQIDLIANSNLPVGFGFTSEGVTYNGYPLENEQLSSSAKYIAGLKLARLSLGDLDTIHFDASTLDKNSLIAVKEWADAEGLQILVERPEYDGDGTIKYDFI